MPDGAPKYPSAFGPRPRSGRSYGARCSLKSAAVIIGPASMSSTDTPRSASTFVTVPPPAPDPITTTSWTVELVPCGIGALLFGECSTATALRTQGSRLKSPALRMYARAHDTSTFPADLSRSGGSDGRRGGRASSVTRGAEQSDGQHDRERPDVHLAQRSGGATHGAVARDRATGRAAWIRRDRLEPRLAQDRRARGESGALSRPEDSAHHRRPSPHGTTGVRAG